MGLLDGIDEAKVANDVMQELGFNDNDVVVQEPTPTYQEESQSAPEPSYDSVDAPTELDSEFEAAERRLSKAILYRQLIKGRFFDGDGELIIEVENELKEFVKKQYLVLSGALKQISVVTAPKDFLPEEITVLKSLAGQIIKRPKLLEAKPVKTPQLQPRPVPVVQKPVEAPKNPELKPRRVPEEAQAKLPPKQPNKQDPKPVRLINNTKLTIPKDESVVEENGQRYKIKYIEMPNIDEYGIMDGGKIRKLGDNESCMLTNGIQVIKNGQSCHKILRTLITNNQNVPGRLPFPSIGEMQVLSERIATQATSHYPSIDGILGRKR
jgi:hemin uptake protein HemP